MPVPFAAGYGLPLTTAVAPDAAHYGEALWRRLAAEAGVAERLAAAVAADPDFTLAHAALAVGSEYSVGQEHRVGTIA